MDREAIRRLSAALVRIAPTLGARVAHAVAVARVDGPDAGLALLDDVAGTEAFQPAWAARAALLAAAGHDAEAERARFRALELTVDPLERDHLATRMPRI